MDKKKVKKIRCYVCRKKLSAFTVFTCKCSKNLCDLHRFPFEHDCSCDKKIIHKKKLEIENPKLEKKKIDKI